MSDNEKNEDYEFVKEELKELFENSKRVLEAAADFAVDSENPKATQAYSKLAADMSGILAKMIDIKKTLAETEAKKKESVSKEKEPGLLPTVQNNVFFHGSPTDLKRMLDEKKPDRLKTIDAIVENEKNSEEEETEDDSE